MSDTRVLNLPTALGLELSPDLPSSQEDALPLPASSSSTPFLDAPKLFGPLKEKTKVTLAPPVSLLIGRTQGLSSAFRAGFRNRTCVGDGAPIAFLQEVGIWLGPLQCFQGKVRIHS